MSFSYILRPGCLFFNSNRQTISEAFRQRKNSDTSARYSIYTSLLTFWWELVFFKVFFLCIVQYYIISISIALALVIIACGFTVGIYKHELIL